MMADPKYEHRMIIDVTRYLRKQLLFIIIIGNLLIDKIIPSR